MLINEYCKLILFKATLSFQLFHLPVLKMMLSYKSFQDKIHAIK